MKPLPTNPGAMVEPRFAGAYYSPTYSGQGIDVHINDDGAVALYWYTAEQDGSGLVYMFGNSLDGGEFVLYTTRGGTWVDPRLYDDDGKFLDGRSEDAFGTGKIEFFEEVDDDGKITVKAIFNFRTIDNARGAIDLVPAAPLSRHPMDGLWYDPEVSGSGFTMKFVTVINEKNELEDRAIIYWFTYDQDGEQLWYSCEGVKEGDGYRCEILRVDGLKWNYPSAVKRVVVGEALVQIVVPDEILFGFTMNNQAGTGAPIGGHIDLQCLFRG